MLYYDEKIRNKLKEEINNKIGELNVRIRILEEHEKDFKK